MKPEEKNKLLRIANSLNLSQSQQEQLEAYVLMLREWSGRVNLISTGDAAKIVDKHIVESLWFCHESILDGAATVLDLGSGGGFPGIPMKIATPGLEMALLESRRNKALFLREAIERLCMKNIRVLCERAENLAGMDSGFRPVELVVCRAVATLVKLARWGAPLLVPGGRIAALKGGDIGPELAEWRRENPGADIAVMEIDERFGPAAANDSGKMMVIMRFSNP